MLHEKPIEPELEQKLCNVVRSSTPLMSALVAVRSLGLTSWCIGAGAVRSLVWDQLHGFETPTLMGDIDVVYFDHAFGDLDQESQLEERLRKINPDFQWEVANQAHIHHWFADHLGQTVPPVISLADGISTWPEIATCVGVYLGSDYSIKVIAPFGLEDLFGMHVRHNPRRASAETYRERVNSKRFAERWPLLSIE